MNSLPYITIKYYLYLFLLRQLKSWRFSNTVRYWYWKMWATFWRQAR